jgi:hypothetical protein
MSYMDSRDPDFEPRGEMDADEAYDRWRDERCEDCNGTGRDSGALNEPEPCPTCDGTGIEPLRPVKSTAGESAILSVCAPFAWACTRVSYDALLNPMGAAIREAKS